MHDNEEKTFDDNIRGQGFLNMLQILQRINYASQQEINTMKLLQSVKRELQC